MAANGVYYSLNQGLLLSTNEITRVDISTGGTVTFNSAYSFPNSDGTNTQVLQTDGNGSLSFGQVQNSALQNSSLTVTAGDGLTGGGSITLGSSATVNVDYAGADNVILAATNQTSTQVTTGSKIMVSDASNDVNYHNVSDLPFTNNAGTVTSVGITAGALVDVSNSPITTSGNITVAVDLSELTTTSDDSNADFIPIINSSNQQFKIAPGNVALSLFDNDQGWTSNVGTVTSVAVTGTDGIDVDSGSPITSSGTITLGLSNVPNSSLANSSITFAADSGSNQIMSLGDTFTVEGGGGMLTSTGTDKVVVSHYNAGSAPSNISSNNSNGTVLQDLSLSFDTYGHITGATVGTTDLDSRYFTETEADARFLSFRTINVPNGTDPVADAYNDTLNFTSSDGSVVINGNSSTDTIDFTIGASVDTFVTGGTFSSGSLTLGRSDGSSATAITGFGTVTSVAISGTDGIDVDSGSPITDSGTITLGLSNVPNSSLQNSSIDIAGTDISLGGQITGDNIIADVSAGEILLTQLEEDSITINGTPVALGGSINVGDITGVSAGNGLTGGGTTGSVTLNVGAGTGISVAADTVSLDYNGTDNFIDSATDLEGTGIALGDTIVYHDATDDIVKKGFVSDLPFTNTSGTVTSVAISGSDGIDVDSGSPITSSGTIALGLSNVPNSSLQNSSIDIAGSDISLGGQITGDNIIADVSAGEILLTQLEEDSITINGTPVTLGGSINVGDITAVTAGNGLTGGGTTGSVTLTVGAGTLIDVDGTSVNVDLSELTTSTSDADGDFFVVVDSANNQKKLTKGNINNSGFNNDAGYITSAGNTNIYSSNGTLSGARTLSQSGNRLKFDSSSAESFDIVKTTAATGDNTPRVFIEADGAYGTVLEIESPDGGTDFIVARNTAGDRLFTVDGDGNLSAQSKSFDIEHPTKEGKRLHYGSLEGPEHGVYVRGRLNGNDTIELPDYWLGLVDENTITVQVTPVGSSQPLYVKDIRDNKVIIGNGSVLTNTPINCFYFVQAERKDVPKIQVEY